MVTDKHVVEIESMNTALTSKSKAICKLEIKAEEVDNNTAAVLAKLIEKRDILIESNAKLESEYSKMHAQIQELSNEATATTEAESQTDWEHHTLFRTCPA